MHIRHSFSDAHDRSSYYTWYKQGAIFKEYRTKDYRDKSELRIYLKECILRSNGFKSRRSNGTHTSEWTACVYRGNILRSLWQGAETIYWAIDFVPKTDLKAR
jgi:hypothetical protein